jgi:hypothetical protein
MEKQAPLKLLHMEPVFANLLILTERPLDPTPSRTTCEEPV